MFYHVGIDCMAHVAARLVTCCSTGETGNVEVGEGGTERAAGGR